MKIPLSVKLLVVYWLFFAVIWYGYLATRPHETVTTNTTNNHTTCIGIFVQCGNEYHHDESR